MNRQVASPEQELCFAVVKLAIEDLESPDEEARYEAHEFMFQKYGGWANMRRMYFDLLGLDEEPVQAKLAHLCDPPERPEKKWTQMEVYEVMPVHPVKAKDIANVVGLRYSQITARFQRRRAASYCRLSQSRTQTPSQSFLRRSLARVLPRRMSRAAPRLQANTHGQ